MYRMTEEFIVFDTVDNSDEVYDISGGYKLPDFMYEEIKDKISRLLNKYNVRNIPVNVFALARKLDIKLVKFSDLTDYEIQSLAIFGVTEDTAGFYALVEKNGRKAHYIYYNDKLELGRVRFTILHEIGHIVLDHIEQSDLAEAEANFFAKYLIAPPILVDKIKPIDYTEIKAAFLLSTTCAWNSFDYYQSWKRHHSKVKNYEEYEKRILSSCSLVVPEPYKNKCAL